MANLRPQNTFLGLAHTKESAYGTAIASGSIDKRYDLVEPSLAEVVKTTTNDAELIKGHEFAADSTNTGALTMFAVLAQDATVPVVFPASYELAGLLWALALGTKSTSGVGPYTHTLTAQDATTSALDQLPSTSMVQGIQGDTATYYKYKGCVLNELRMAVDGRGRVNFSSTFFSDGSATADASFTIPARSTQLPIFGKDFTFKIADAGTSPATQTTLLRGLEISWNNNHSREDNRGQIAEGTSLTGLRFGTRSISLTVRLQGNKGDARWTDFTGNTQKDVEIAATSGTSSMTFNFDRCRIASVRDSFDDIRNTIEVTFEPYTITATGVSPVQVVVVNGISSYL